MTSFNFYIRDDEAPTAVDVPAMYAETEEDRLYYIDNFFIPLRDSGLLAASENPEHPLSSLPDWAARGAYRLAQASNVAQVHLGLDNPENAAKDVQDYQRYLSQVPYEKDTAQALLSMSEADSLEDFWDAASTTAGLKAIGNVVGESFTQFAPVILATLATIPFTGGMSATAGSIMLGSISGLGSLGIEYGAASLSAMNDYLKEKGTNARDDKAVAQVFANEEKMKEFSNFALKRGIPIGVIDGLSMGFAGKITNALIKARKEAAKAAKIKRAKTPTSTTLTEIGPKVPSKIPERVAIAGEALILQPAAGGAGEALAQQVSGEGFKLGEVALETIAEIPGGTVETGIGVILNNAREKKAEQVRENLNKLTAKKEEELKKSKGKEEIAIVRRDLETEGVNPETGEPDFIQYEQTAFNFQEEPIKAGNKAFSINSIKKWFNGEIKQPLSKRVIIDYFLRKGYIEKIKGKGRSEYQWTPVAEERSKVLTKGEGQQLGLFTEEEEVVDSTAPIEQPIDTSGLQGDPRVMGTEDPIELVETSKIEETVSPEFKGTEVEEEVSSVLDPEITARIDAAMGDSQVISHPVVELINIIRTNLGEEQANEAQAYAEAKQNVATKQRQESKFSQTYLNSLSESEANLLAPIPTGEGTVTQAPAPATPEATVTQAPSTATPEGTVTQAPSPTSSDTVTQAVDITDLPPTPTVTLSEAQANLEELDLEIFPTPDALPPESPVQLELPFLDLEPVTPNLSNSEVDFINETTPFTLRRKGEDRDTIRDEIKANIDMITVSQILYATGTKVPMSVDEQDYLQNAFADESEFISNIISDIVVTTNDQQRTDMVERNRKLIDNLSLQQIAGTAFEMFNSVWHTTRIAEKFKSYRPFTWGIIGRREKRERINNLGMTEAAPLYEDTSVEDSKKLGQVSAILDALYSGRRDKSILSQEIGPNRTLFIENKKIKIIIPEEPPMYTDKEGNDLPVMNSDRYKVLLKELDVKEGDILELNEDLTNKFNVAQSTFKLMFDINLISFVNFMLQRTPLHEGITRGHDDTTITLKDKMIKSMELYIDDINTLLPEEQKISESYKKSLKNARLDSSFFKSKKKGDTEPTNLNNLFDRIPKDNKNATNIGITLRSQYQALAIVNDQQKVLKEHPFYLPRLRYGDFFFTVKDKTKEKNLIAYYTETPSATSRTTKSKRKALEKERKRVKELYGSEYTVSEIFDRSKSKDHGGLDDSTLNKVKKLGEQLGYSPNDSETTEGKFFLDVQEQLQKVGFGKFLAQRDEEIISGYYNPQNRDNYLPIVLSNYIRSAADTSSTLDYLRPIQKSIDHLEKGVENIETGERTVAHPLLAKLANKTEEHIKGANEPGALFKTFAFHYALGGNFSSAMVNLSQSFVTTLPMLSMITGDPKDSTKEVIRGLRDARRLFGVSKERLATYGFDFTSPTSPDFLSQDEWNMLRKMYRDGVIQAIVNLDLGAKLQQDLGSTLQGQRVSNKKAKMVAKALEASSFMFGAMEQVNRIAVALATYRLAVKSDKNLNRFQKFSQSTLFAEENMTPERAAKMMVYKTQFLIGKENRPALFRSAIGNVGTQFLSFVQQYIGMYAQALNMIMGKDKESKRMGSIMLGSLMLSMWAFAGFMGLPYLENLKQLLRASSGLLGGYGFDLEYGMKEAMNTVLNPYVTDVIMHGPFSRLTGVDISKRIGVGEPIPFNVMQGNLMAASGPAGSLAIDAGKRIIEAIKLGDAGMLITAALPLGSRNFVEGSMGAISQLSFVDDKPIRTTQGRVLLPGSEIDLIDRGKQMFGFTPMKVAAERERKSFINFQKSKARPVQDSYLTELSEKMAARRITNSLEQRRELTEEIQNIRREIREINKIARKEGRFADIINATPRALRDRMRIILRGQSHSLVKAARKRLGGIQRATDKVNEMAPPGTSLLDALVGN